jgi:hypothetical protein
VRQAVAIEGDGGSWLYGEMVRERREAAAHPAGRPLGAVQLRPREQGKNRGRALRFNLLLAACPLA